MIREEIKAKFDEVHNQCGNIVDGHIEWSYVEADIMMHFGVDRLIEELGSLEQFYVIFNELVDAKLDADAKVGIVRSVA